MKLTASLTCALALGACGTNDSDDPGTKPGAREFKLTIENIAPWKLLKSSSQSTIAGTMMTGNLFPGQAYEVRFTAGPGHYLSFASSLIESNDWFFAPEDPQGVALYVNGQRRVGDITNLVRLWDAGTEINQELGTGNATCGKQPMRDYGAPDPDSRVRLVSETQINGWPVPAVASMIKVTLAQGTTPDSFVMRIENISNDSTLQTSAGWSGVRVSPVAWAISRNPNAFFDPNQGVRPNGLGPFAETGLADTLTNQIRLERGVATPLGRGVFLVHREDDLPPLFNIDNSDFGMGMEQLAEDGDEQSLLTNLKSAGRDTNVLGALNTQLGSAKPGEMFEVKLKAAPGDRLAIAMMYSMSNDWYFASPPDGIALFLGENPRWEEVTPDLRLYDLGTEEDQELDVGLAVGTQQAAPATGRPDRTTNVREVLQDRYTTPINQHIRVTLTPAE